jgi:hypothetical protein
MLQAAEAEPFILDAVLAVSALHKIISSVPDICTSDVLRQFKDEHHFAVQKYQKSLVCMRNAISNRSMDTRTALIACILTICFENAYGRRDMAIFNCLAGSRLRRQFSIPLLGNGPLPRALTGSTVKSDAMEDELVDLFARLDISSMVFVDFRSIDEHRVLKDELNDVAEEIPFIFYTFSEAASYCNVVMSCCWHFMKIIQGLGRELSGHPLEKGRDERWVYGDLRYG